MTIVKNKEVVAFLKTQTVIDGEFLYSPYWYRLIDDETIECLSFDSLPEKLKIRLEQKKNTKFEDWELFVSKGNITN